MLKLLKHLKKSVVAILFVTILLIIQANSDLSLPSYTSDIINIGIIKGGIDYTVPEVIGKSELEKITLFIEPWEQDIIFNHFSLLDKSKNSEKEWNAYLNKYPTLSEEGLYLWDGEQEDEISAILSLPMTTLLIIDNYDQLDMEVEGQPSLFPAELETMGGDFYTFISSLPEEARKEFLTSMKDKMSQMPEMLLSQSVSAYIKAEYERIGINLSKIQTRYILITGAKMLGLALLAMIASILVTLLSAKIGAKLSRDIRSDVFQKVLSFSNTEMDKFSTASLITRSTNDVQQVQMLIIMMIRIVIYAPILAVGGIFKVLNTNSSMTWIITAGVVTIFILIILLLIISLPKFRRMQKLIDRINLVMREILTGLPVIRAFSTEDHEKKRFEEANIDLTKNSLFVNRVMTFLMPSLMFIMNLISLLIVWVGADRIDQGTMQVGDMVAFIQYTMQIIMSFLMLTMISIILPRAGVSARRLGEVLSVESSIQDPKTEESFTMKREGRIEFHNVSFRYPNADEDVLSDISFVAKPGETTAIIGSTGSGKSTLINLIPRFYDVTKGKILLDGTDIRKIKQHTLRERLGFVPQKGVLFTGTIESNIKFGKENASEKEVIRAARIAQALEFIEAKPEGYESPISQGGTNVSGGQKQRLSIARAIAKAPDIFIFDDSFSALDYKTDATLRKTLKEELSDKCIIIVAQRISTIMHAEQILVLDNGKIVGKGTHKDLLAGCEVYRQIASSQLSKEELEYE